MTEAPRYAAATLLNGDIAETCGHRHVAIADAEQCPDAPRVQDGGAPWCIAVDRGDGVWRRLDWDSDEMQDSI